MKRTLVSIAVAALLGLAGAGFAFAEVSYSQRTPQAMSGETDTLVQMDMGRGEFGVMHMAGLSPEAPWITFALDNRDQIKLTAEQVSRLESLRAEFLKESERKTDAIRLAEAELAILLHAERVNLDQAKAKVNRIGDLETELRTARITTLIQGREILTVEQRTSLASLVAQTGMGQQRGRMGHMSMPMGPGSQM